MFRLSGYFDKVDLNEITQTDNDVSAILKPENDQSSIQYPAYRQTISQSQLESEQNELSHSYSRTEHVMCTTQE